MAKPKLLILSDLFGGKNPEWINYYINALESEFEIQYYDALELATIDAFNLTETDIHKQFLNSGIDKAVENLLTLEKNNVLILGFSIGGTIAWKASLQGLKTTHLSAISSTRLRDETKAPNCEINLYFGEKDPNKPNPQWFLDLNITSIILENYDHQLYHEQENALMICDKLIMLLKNGDF